MDDSRFRELVSLYNKLMSNTGYEFLSRYIQKGVIAYAAREGKRIKEMHALTNECNAALYKQAKIYACIGDLIPDVTNIPQEYIGLTEKKLNMIVKECLAPGSKRGKEILFGKEVRIAWLIDAAKLSTDDLTKKLQALKGKTPCECTEWEEKTEIIKKCKKCGKRAKQESGDSVA